MIQQTLLFLSNLTLGIFLGAQITEAFLFVPNWKALSPHDFFEFYGKYGKKILQFFAPITIAATLSPILAAGYTIYNKPTHTLIASIMGISAIAFFSTFFLYFKWANQRFFNRSLEDQELAGELKKWGNWHWTRIGFEMIAFVCSLVLSLII